MVSRIVKGCKQRSESMRSPHPNTESHTQRGFTLIELSIVLVIIGLIVGGVLVGRSLIGSAELSTIITDKNKYTAAINTFRTKYNVLPGDMRNATSFWGIAGGNASDNYTDSCYASGNRNSPSTCNGNGDGNICSGGPDYWNYHCSENHTAWQHLANAKMVQGAFASGPWVYGDVLVGTNIPASKVRQDSGYSLTFLCPSSPLPIFFANNLCKHVLMYGTQASNLPGSPTGDWLGQALYPALTAPDAKSIDVKIDDGSPGTGSVNALASNNWNAFNTACTTTEYPDTAVYESTSNGLQCSLVFNAGF